MNDKLKFWIRIYDLIRDQYWWVLTDESSGFPESLDKILESDMPDSAMKHMTTTPTGRQVIQDKFVVRKPNGKEGKINAD